MMQFDIVTKFETIVSETMKLEMKSAKLFHNQ